MFTSQNKIQAKFTFVDLFSGIGGFHLAMHKIGGKCVFASEIDDYARKTYKFNFSKISPDLFEGDKGKNNFVGDIKKISYDLIPDHDILCAGFPCQPFSQAGFKRGFEDERGTLFFNIAKIVESKKPKVVLLENVRGLLSHDAGNTFKVIKETFYDLEYSVFYKVIKASDFNLPQLRPRLFIVAFRGDINSNNFDFPNPIPLTFTMSQVFEGANVNRDIGYTLRVGGKSSPINNRRNWDGYMVDGKIKRLTSKEAKKMQGFPEEFEFPVTEYQAMKQLGNSVAINVVEELGAKILKTIENYLNLK
jgi:DNA (cytosine-5)-methyltransferase 1